MSQATHRFLMDHFLLTFSLLSLLLSSAFGDFSADQLIRQVVPEEEQSVNLLNADHHFSLFKAKFGKSYSDEKEHDYRFSVFKANLLRAKRNQLLDPSAEHGVTQFSDLTPSEFKQRYLGLKRPAFLEGAQKAPILPTNNLPEDFDWRDKGAVTGVKNQVYIHILLIYFIYLGSRSVDNSFN